jgi:hypothetical protein
MGKRLELVGKTFGRLTVIERDNNDSTGHVKWLCRCICGTISTVRGNNLKRGGTKSCGCLQKEQNSIRTRIRPHERIYNILCRNAKKRKVQVDIAYEDYLKFTDKPNCHYCYSELIWNKHPNVRQNDSQAHNLDRKDNTKGYTVDNCVECCYRCNKCKSDEFTHAEWFRMCEPFRTGELKH